MRRGGQTLLQYALDIRDMTGYSGELVTRDRLGGADICPLIVDKHVIRDTRRGGEPLKQYTPDIRDTFVRESKF